MTENAAPTTVRTWLLVAGGIALFLIAGLVGYRWGTNDAEDETPTVIANYGGEVVTQPSDEAWREQAETVVHDESVRALEGVGSQEQLAALDVDDVREGPRSGRDGSTFSRIDARSGRESSSASGGSPSIPREVIDDGFLWQFIDMAEVPFAPVPDDFRFDLCAGPNPFADPPPGCPGGSGATIIPLDEHAYYSIDWFNDGECVTDNDAVRLALLATRPSRVEVSAWNYRGADLLGHEPDRAADQTVTVQSTGAEVDAWLASPPTPVRFCVELTGLDRGVIHLKFEGSSVLPLESDLSDDGARDVRWYAAGLDRPPTTAVPLTVDTVYVSAYRRSVDDQQTFVQARVYGEQSCDNAGDISLIGDNPQGIQSDLEATVELRTHIGGWPWDPSWDRADIHKLRLETGKLYLLCAYWVESGGPSFEPDRVVRTEVMLAVPPDLATMTVSVDNIQFIGLEDDPRVNSVSVIPTDFGAYGCRGVTVSTNSSVTETYVLGPDELCTVVSPGREFDRGGFEIETRAVDSLGDTYTRSVFVRVRPTDIRCDSTCEPVVRRASLPLPYVPKRALTGHAEWPGTFDTGAIPPEPEGETGFPAGTVGLELRFVPTGFNWWAIDTFREVDQTPRGLPARPQLDVDVTSTASRSSLSSAANVELVADRDVSVEASVKGPGGGSPCAADAAGGLDYTSTERSSRHAFSFSGLCPGTQYELHVTALDETGTPGEVTLRPSLADVQVVPFGTVGIDVAVDVEFVVLGAPPAEGGNVFHVRHLPQFEIYSLIPGYRSATPRVVPTNAVGSVVTNPNTEAAEAGWTFNLPYNSVMCVAEAGGTPGASFVRRATPSQRNWPVRTTADGVRIRFQVEYGMAPRLFIGESSTTSSSLCTSSFPSTGTYTLDEVLTFDQLSAGVEFISGDGLFAIRVSG